MGGGGGGGWGREGGVAFHHTDLCLLCHTFVKIILELYAYEVEVSLHKK